MPMGHTYENVEPARVQIDELEAAVVVNLVVRGVALRRPAIVTGGGFRRLSVDT